MRKLHVVWLVIYPGDMYAAYVDEAEARQAVRHYNGRLFGLDCSEARQARVEGVHLFDVITEEEKK